KAGISKDEEDTGDLNGQPYYDYHLDLQYRINDLKDNNEMKTVKVLPRPWKKCRWTTPVIQV
ncbi:hypothetical protein TNCT_686181, partial [Trichonephila clavata]